MDFFNPVRPEISLAAILVYALFTFLFALLATPWFVRFLQKNKIGKQLRVETMDGRAASVFLKFHHKKSGTPTMGGLLIWGSILFTVGLSRVFAYFGLVENSLLQRGQVYLPLFAMVTLGILGAVDDYWNVCGWGKKKGGIDVLPKITFLIVTSLLGALWFHFQLQYNTIHIPFVGELTIGFWYVPLFMFVFVSMVNAVNFTDGLDGLAGGLLVIAFLTFGVLAWMTQLYILAAFCAVTVAAIAAFLWHNVPPAIFIMGDTGSMALGGTLAVIAMMMDRVLILPLIGAIFVLEAVSVVVQLTSKKFRNGKKIFLAAPIHHHFEALEWGESKVTMRFWIIGGFFAFLGLIVGVVG